MKLDKAIALASKEFEGRLDKGGKPYILHCLRVMFGVQHLGELAMTCAVLHDVLEDTHLSAEDLAVTFGTEVALIVDLLSHRPSTPYMDYIKALSVHPIAKEIKKADLKDNSDITRLKGLRKKDFDRLEKYSIAYTYLND